MLKIFLSSTYRDLAEYRSKILEKLNAAFKGVGMEQFIPDGSNSQEVCIGKLKENDAIIFLISPYYGSLIDTCSLKENCKAECPMKTDTGRISYTHCEYKTTVAEEILHQTYLVGKGWDAPEVKKEALQFKEEIGEEYLGFVDIEDPDLVQNICNNLATKIIEWHTQDKLNFTQFCDREKVLNELIDNIGSKVEVWGVGGIGKTALIEVALLIQKLKGKRILTIGTSKAYASGSGFEDFRTKCKDDQYTTESRNEITIYDVMNAFADKGFLPDAEEVSKLPKEKIIEILSKTIQNEEDFILFIDDFHLATKDVMEVAKSLDHLILSSRKNTYIARQEIYLSGIDEEDRENLIKLFSTEIPESVRKLINKIAEGHPVSTELLVRNYENIDFDKIRDFDLTDADDTQVKDFYKRVIEEIFSNNTQALTLLKDLAILNTDLPTNIHRESVLKTYDIQGIRKVFKNLVDTGMIKKRPGSESVYEFYFKHIQDYLEDEAEKANHEKAIFYYSKKKEVLNDSYTINDEVEVFYHKVKTNHDKLLLDLFHKLSNKIQPVHYGFKRLIDVGSKLKNSFENYDKAFIQNWLGQLYRYVGRFEEVEAAFIDALDIYNELAATDPDAYLLAVANTQTNLGALYHDLGRFAEAEATLIKALDIYKNSAVKNPDACLPQIAHTLINFGRLYVDLVRYEEAETAFIESYDIYKDLAAIDPDAFLPAVANTQNHLGILYWNLERFEEAESAYIDALDFFKELAVTNPDAYLLYVAIMQNNLGILYRSLGKFTEAETVYKEALVILERLAVINPDAYLVNVADTQLNLCLVYVNLERFEEAERLSNRAFDIYQSFSKRSLDVYRINVAGVWYTKACLESARENKEKSIEFLKKSIEFEKKRMDYAKKDKHSFESIRHSKEFKELIGE